MKKDTKKVVLLIVEGPSDESSLSPFFKQLFDKENVLFKVVHGDITTKENIKCINQNLKVVINNKRFTFYVNHSEYLDYKKKGVYYFLVMYIHNDSIYGYEINEDKYYSLKFERKLILNNIDQKITRALEDMEKQDLYTYLLYNNEIRGLIIKIDKTGNDQFRKTPNFAKLDKPFESIFEVIRLLVILINESKGFL